MKPVALGQGGLVVGRALDDAPEPVTRRIDRLAVEVAVSERVGTDGHLDLTDHETLDVVHIEALVDPVHEQGLRPLGLGPDLPAITDLHGLRRGDEREDAEGELSDRSRSARSPATDADVGLDLEVLPPQALYTADQIASDHVKSGMLIMGGAKPLAADAPSPPNYNLSVRVFDEKTGKPVTDANVGLYREPFDRHGELTGNFRSIPVVKMQAIGEGAASIGYGNNVRLNARRYRISTTLNGMDLTFFTKV